MRDKSCADCRNQLTGFDGGFFGLPVTCECKIFGETENRKDCKKFEKRITKNDLLNEIAYLRKENEQLRKLLKERQYEKDITKCREQNEQLKEHLNQLQTSLNYWQNLYKDVLDKLPPKVKELWIE